MVASLSGLAYRLGEPTTLHELTDRGLTAEQASLLHERGQRVCPVASSEVELVAAAIAQTLMEAGGEARTVDRVLIATGYALVGGDGDEQERMRARLCGLLADLGLGHAPLTIVAMSGCAAGITIAEYATLLVDSGASRRVLVVAVDRVPDGESRMLPPSVSVLADGAASCIVGPGPGLRLQWVRRRGFLDSLGLKPDVDFGPALVRLGRCLRALGHELQAEETARDALLLCNNYGLPTIRLFGRTLGVPDERTFTANVPVVGHLGTADPLVNLAEAVGTADEFLVLATGPADCALALVSKQEEPDVDS